MIKRCEDEVVCEEQGVMEVVKGADVRGDG